MSQALAPSPVAAREEQLYAEAHRRVHVRNDRLFAALLIAEWLGGIVAALVLTPWTWAGTERSLHANVWAAILLGGTNIVAPVWLALLHPGRAYTRHVIAVSQMLAAALLIHCTGGRIETQVHLFGSLAFLAFYRDWRVLVTGTPGRR